MPRPPRVSVVVVVLRGSEAVGDQALHGICRAFDVQAELLALGPGEVAKHPVGRVLPTGRAADADSDSMDLSGPHRAAQRLQPVVAVVAAAELESQHAVVEV